MEKIYGTRCCNKYIPKKDFHDWELKICKKCEYDETEKLKMLNKGKLENE